MKVKYRRLDRCCVTCADVQSFISETVSCGITIYDVQLAGELTIHFYVSPKYRNALETLADKHSAHLQIHTGFDSKRILRLMKKRAVLLSGLFILVVISVVLPQRILFVEVSGNEKLPENLIREKAALCGIDFWKLRREVRSEQVKNALLSALPQLQWVGVNTSGCTATISVIERSEDPEKVATEGVCNIIAAHDGIIKDCTVIRGNPLCKPGQAVKKGQVLVSGYVDAGLLIRAVNAKAEITGQTNRSLSIISIHNSAARGRLIREDTKYSLIIGKKLINLYKDSGILDSSCVKINKIYPLTLPGGLTLPVSLLCQQILYYEPSVDSMSISDNSSWICEFASSYLTEMMIAGKILDSDVDIQLDEDALYFTGNYSCEEMIGKTLNEEKLYSYAKDN